MRLVAIGRLSLNIGGRRGEIGGNLEAVPKHWWEERGGIGGNWKVGGRREVGLNIGGRREVGLVAIGRLSVNIGGRREVGLVAIGRLSLNIGGRRGEIGGN